MNARWGPAKRTRADQVRDVQSFCVSATLAAFRAKSLDDLTRMAGGDVTAAKYWQAWRDGKGW